MTTQQQAATDTCQGCGRSLYFDEDAEIYRLADDPDAIFCSGSEGVDDHYPADVADEAPTDDDATPTTTYVAEFVKAAHADAFAKRVTSDSFGCTNVVHRTGRRKVMFDGPATGEYRMDIAETIGFYGSPPMGPVATLDGYPTPRSY